jgi:3-oxoacyl-[acyl-carrier-protein] synthase II
VRAALRGLGWVTASGPGRGRDGSPFAWAPGELPKLSRHPAFGTGVSRAGRRDEFTRLGFVAAALAWEDAGLGEGRGELGGTVGAVASSSFGCLSTDHAYYETAFPQGGLFASPNLFAYTLPNCFLGEVAIRFGLTGPGYVLSEVAPTGLEPLRQGLELVEWGECSTVLAGVSDVPRLGGAGSPPALPPGAVFVVLGAGPSDRAAPYGDLVATTDGTLQWNGEAVSGLGELVERILAERPSH